MKPWYYFLRSVLNILFALILIVYTIILYERIDGHWNDNSNYTKIDHAFFAIYSLPFGISYLFAVFIVTMFMLDEFRRGRSNKFHADIFCFFCLNIIFRWSHHFYDYNSNNNTIYQCCNYLSTNIIMVIINSILTYIIIAIIILFLPLLLITGAYNRDYQLRDIALFIQFSIVIIYTIFQLFCLEDNTYGYHAVIIISCGLLYSFIGYYVLRLSEEIHTSTSLFLTIETIQFYVILTITFLVDYQDSNLIYHRISVIAFINYLFPNVPFSKIFIWRYLQNRLCKHKFWLFTREYPTRMRTKDAVYCIVHEFMHQGRPKNDDENELESVSLLIKDDSWHKRNSAQCFRMQYEYLQSDWCRKRSIIREMHPKKAADDIMLAFIIIYWISTIINCLYPLFWIVYVWIYLEINETASDVKWVFVWIMNVLYLLMLLGILMGILMDDTFMDLILSQGIISSVWSLRNQDNINMKHVKELYERQDVVKCLLDSDQLQSDIGLIILSYLY